ncbi:MAG: hypothetical protein AB7P40_03860 [Chloroflexota bacterium]
MTAVRAVLIATIIIGLAVAPLAAPVFGLGTSDQTTAYAAFAGGARAGDRTIAPMQDNSDNGNNNGNANNNNNNNNNNNDNGDDNDNEDNDDNDNGDGDDNDNADVVVVVKTPTESVNLPTKCFDNGELGVIQLGTGSYDVTVQVMPHSSFGQTTRMTLRSLDPASVPSPGSAGTLIDSVVFQLDAQSSCDGAAIGQLPNYVNMGIIYNVTNAVDKSKLQIVRLEGGSWTNVDTVPDPVSGNPYVSTSINWAGTYALIQKP